VRTTGSYPGYNQPKYLFYDLISASGLTRRDHDSIPFAIMEPIYTAENTTAAYQLNGSLALFGKTKIPDQEIWLNELKTATELDGVRILPSKNRSDNTVQFFVSTCLRLSPADVVRSVKERLQFLIRVLIPRAFRSILMFISMMEPVAATIEVMSEFTLRKSLAPPGQARNGGRWARGF
jgi:hypothetical protein